MTASATTTLDLAIRVERLAARTYAILAERFEDEPEARDLFRRLEAEEHEHALRIEMLAGTLARRPELDQQLVLDGDRMQQVLREGEALAALLAPPTPRPPLARARELAAHLEEKFASVHSHQLASLRDPELRAFFAVFVAQDRAHAALLRGERR